MYSVINQMQNGKDLQWKKTLVFAGLEGQEVMVFVELEDLCYFVVRKVKDAFELPRD
jgi:hypothetical protein